MSKNKFHSFIIVPLVLSSWFTLTSPALIKSLPDTIEIDKKVISTNEYKPDYAFLEALKNHFYCNADSALCPGVAMAVIDNGNVLFMDGYGVCRKGSQKEISLQTVFRIASISKGFAGILTSKIIEEGDLDLNDPVSKYLPEFIVTPKAGRDTIRVWHLLAHVTGFTTHAYSNLISEGKDLDFLLKSINKLNVRDYPGQSYAYQNAAFAMIEKILENVTGVEYPRLLDSLILTPLGMCSASTSLKSIQAADEKALGHKYMGTKNGFQHIPLQSHYYNTISAGGLNASIQDMAVWLKAMMGYYPEVISTSVLNTTFTPRVSTSKEPKYFNRWENMKSSHYGLGWRIVEFPKRNIIFHGGNVNGFRSEIGFDPAKQLGVVLLFNSTCSYSNEAIPKFFEFYDQYYKNT